MNGKHWLKKADGKIGTVARLLYPRCACLNDDCKGKLEFHHLISRGVKHLRHDPRNAIILCTYHHTQSIKMSPHGAPKLFTMWLHNNMHDHWHWRDVNMWAQGEADYKEAFQLLEKLEEVLRGGMDPKRIIEILFKTGGDE